MKYFILFYILFFSACVSVKLDTKPKVVKAKNYSLVVPSLPFSENPNPAFDRFWMDESSGNSIGIQTSCGDDFDPSLAELNQKVIRGIDEIKILRHNEIFYNDRRALHTAYSGSVDGVKIKIENLIFKKHNCNYILSFFGTEKYFEDHLSDFEIFTRNFRVR